MVRMHDISSLLCGRRDCPAKPVVHVFVYDYCNIDRLLGRNVLYFTITILARGYSCGYFAHPNFYRWNSGCEGPISSGCVANFDLQVFQIRVAESSEAALEMIPG